MMQFTVQVRVQFKPSVFDPQGHAVEQAVHSLGYTEAGDFRIGKYMTFTVTAQDEAAAVQLVDDIGNRVLCNPVMERFEFEVTPAVEAEVGHS